MCWWRNAVRLGLMWSKGYADVSLCVTQLQHRRCNRFSHR
jgi:hypothetical protein